MYSRAPVIRILKGNEKQFELARVRVMGRYGGRFEKLSCHEKVSKCFLFSSSSSSLLSLKNVNATSKLVFDYL